MAYEYGKVKIQVRHKSGDNLERGLYNNTLKIGDGSTAYSSLSGIAGGGGGAGDITAVTAGTGLNGGGTTGAVTVNVDDSVFTTGTFTAGTGLQIRPTSATTVDIDTTVLT